MKKVYASAGEALDGLLHDGMLIAAGGFGLCGIPELLIDAAPSAGLAALIRAAYDPVLPLAATDPSHALRLAARLDR